MQTWCKYNEPTIKRQHYNINCLNVSVNTYSIRSKTQSNTVKNISFSKWTKVNGFALQTFDRKKCESVAPHATQFKLFLDRIKSSILCRSFNSFAEKTTRSNVHYALVTTSSKLASNSRSHDSPVFKWNGNLFTPFQTLSTVKAFDVEPFKIGQDTYLAVAIYYGRGSHIFKWDGERFVKLQDIAAVGADVEHFKINGSTYLALTGTLSDIF